LAKAIVVGRLVGAGGCVLRVPPARSYRLKIVGSASTATCRAVLAAVFLAAMSACGLGLSGESLEGDGDDAAATPSKGDGGSDGRSPRAASSFGSGGDAGNDFDADEPDDDADASFVGALGADAGPPAAADAAPGDASATCSALSVCCPTLSLIGATSLLAACMSTVASNDPSSCQTFVSGFQSFGLCL
jgi:hypothetical protein